MKKHKYIFPLLMAIVMMAMSPMRMWAEDVTVNYADGSQKTFGGGLALNSTNSSGIVSITIPEKTSVIINVDLSINTVYNSGTFKVLKNRTFTVNSLTSSGVAKNYGTINATSLNVENDTIINYGSIAANISVNGGILANRGTITQGTSNDDKVLVKSGGIFLNYDTTYKVVCEEGGKYYNFGEVTYGPSPAICYHEGTLVKTDAVAATCVSTGSNAYWTCSFCEKVFADENATTETTVAALTTAIIDHSYGEDGFCTRCTGVNAPLRASLVTASEGITVEVTAADGKSDHEWECRYHEDNGPCLVSLHQHGKDLTTITLKSTKAFKLSLDYVLIKNGSYCYVDGNSINSKTEIEASGSYLNRNMSAGEHTILLRADGLGDTYKSIISNIKAETIPECNNHVYETELKEEPYIKEAANCEHGNIYYYACNTCNKNEHNDSHTYKDGAAKHTFAEGKVDGVCTLCGRNIPWYEGYESNAAGVENAIHWQIYNDGTTDGYILKITGQGAIKDYPLDIFEGSSAPWTSSYISEKGINVNSCSSIIVGSGITHIGKNVFRGFIRVNSVSLPEGLRSIGESAFLLLGNWDGTIIDQLVIPASVETIGQDAFKGAKINVLHFAENSQLKTIESNAFSRFLSYNINTLVFRGAAKPTIAQDAFTGVQNLTIYYPGGTGWTGVEANYGATDGNITWKTDTPPAIADQTTTDPSTPTEPAGQTPIVLTWSAKNNMAISDYVSNGIEFLFQFTPIETKEYVIKIENSKGNNYEIIRGEVYDNQEMTTPIGIFKHNPVWSDTRNKHIALAPFTLQEGTTYYIKAIYAHFLNPFSNGEQTQLTITPVVYSSTEGKEVTKKWAYDDEVRNQGDTADWEFNNGDLTFKPYGIDIDGLDYFKSYPYLVFKNQIKRVIFEQTDQLYRCRDRCLADVYIPELRLPANCKYFSNNSFSCGAQIGKVYIATAKELKNAYDPTNSIPSYVDIHVDIDDVTNWNKNWNNLLSKNNVNDVYFLSDNVYTQMLNLIASINANEDIEGKPYTEWANLHAPLKVFAKVGDAAPFELAPTYDSLEYTFSAADVLAKGYDPCRYSWTLNGKEIKYGDKTEILTENITLIGTERSEPLHDFSALGSRDNSTGLYPFACANNPQHTKQGVMFIKDYDTNATGYNRHLKLTVNTQNTSYSTSEAIDLTDANQFKDVYVTFTTNSLPTYTRTMTTEWGTLVVPFEISATKEGFEFYSVKDVVDYNALILEKITGNTIAAGTPVFVRRTGANTSFVLQATGNTVNTTGALRNGNQQGSYAFQDLTKGYIIYNDMLWSVAALTDNSNNEGKTVKIAPFHVYIKNGSNGAKLQIIVDEEDATGISLTPTLSEGEGAAGAVYNLQGQRLSAPQKGVNIVNGKKVLVK